MIQAIFFDFDGTLADTAKLAVVATQRAFVAAGLPEPKTADVLHYQGVPIETSFPLLGAADLTPVQLDALFAAFREEYRLGESPATIELFPGIAQVLHNLQLAGKDLFLLTSKKTVVAQRNLALLEVADYFTEIYGSDKVVAYKPNPAGLIDILEKRHIQPDQAAMVGDATFDIEAGNGAGVLSVAVTWGSHDLAKLTSAQPDVIVDDAAALEAALMK